MTTLNNHVPLDSFYILERKGPSRPKVENLNGCIQAALLGLQVNADKLRGKRLAVTVGSRGIANLQEIVRSLCNWLKGRGAQPFIIPAMGSHGGATAEGQRELLAEYGITQAQVGVEVRSSMETVVVGTTPRGFDVYADRNAWESDGIVLLARVKPHSDYSGKVESGLLKMMAIGLGKREGATAGHKQLWKFGFEPTIRAASSTILASGKILLGLAVVENEMHEIADVSAALPEAIAALDESKLLAARAMLPRIPFQKLDLLILNEMGKNISGTGMDLKVVGRVPGAPVAENPAYSMIFLRDLTEKSFGNATGMGGADLIHDRFFRKIDFHKTYVNSTVSLAPFVGRMPMHMPSDRAAIDLALGHLGSPEPASQRIAWISNTLIINRIAVSSSLREQAETPDNWRLAEGPFPLEFDAQGDLISPL